MCSLVSHSDHEWLWSCHKTFFTVRPILDAAFTTDVHEINFRLIEKEMVVQRRHLEAIVERRGQRIVDFVSNRTVSPITIALSLFLRKRPRCRVP